MSPGAALGPYAEIIRRRARPLAPVPSGAAPVLRELRGIRAVLFDVYGTLFISAGGEPAAGSRGAAFGAAVASLGLPAEVDGERGAETLLATIRERHRELRERGIAHPEVDIVEVWRRTLDTLATAGGLAHDRRASDLKALAVEYETRANPVWPMPGVAACLRSLRAAGLLLGIVSNAQFYVHELFPALLGSTSEDLGFDPELQYYSYRHGRAKPGLYLYQRARDTLAERGIAAREVLHVGNDMLNDILPAQRLGLRAALFAGDARSFNPRAGDPRVRGTAPDLVVTDLRAVPGVLLR